MPGFNVLNQESVGLEQEFGLTTDGRSLKYRPSFAWLIAGFGLNVPAKSDIFITLRECSLPSMSSKIESVMGADIEYKFSGMLSTDPLKIMWYDAGDTWKLIYDWYTKIVVLNDFVEDDITVGAGTYKYNSQIIVEDMSHEADDHIQYTLYHSWPSEMNFGELSYTTSEIRMLSVKLEYDYFTVEKY